MNFYEQRESYGQYNNYRSDSRRNSNSFSEEQTGAKRKKTKWSNKRRGDNQNSRNSDRPLFKEPTASPIRSPRVNQSPGRFNRGSYRENQSQPYFNMRDMPDFVEPQHSGSSLNWDNYYHQCKNWQDKHKLAYYRSRCLALEFENQMLFEQINSLIEENCVFASERGVMPTMRLPDMPSRAGGQERAAQAGTTQTRPKKQGKNKKISTTSDTEFGCVVTEDVMEHLEKSMRHRLNLRKKKNQESDKNKTEEEIKKNEDSKKQGPKAPMGQKRKEELDQLYGNQSTVIHGLETSVQLNFNRCCDTYKPELWMAVPLNPATVVA